jgi:hypothetical protein
VIVGTTVSSDFPVTSDAHQAARASTADGSQDAFLARLDADGVVLKYSTYFGGATSQESFRSVRWHPTGVVYVGGSATASDFPLKNAFDTSFGGGYEAIVMKWDRRFALSWSSFAGGSGSDLVQSLGMSADGTTTVAGVTYSSDLPVESAFQSSPASGQDAFFVTVPDSLQTSVPFPSITSSSLPDWTVGFAYSKSPNVSEGTSPYTWTKVSGTLPPGLALDASGVVSGTPTATGLYTFTLRVEDDYEISDERQVTLRINPVPTVATSSLPDWTTGVPFDHALAVTTATGAGGWSWKLLTGTLPPGLALGADGRITGTPTATAFRSFTVEVTDASGAKATKALTLKINPALAVENVDLPPWTEFRPLTHTFGATGGTGDLRWSLLSGTMTVFDGLASQTGTLQGTTLAAGTYEYVLQVKDEVGATATRSYASIVRPTPTVPWAELPPAAVGRPYTGTLAAADGTGPFRWTLTEGSLPPGLVLEESTGRITGTPTAARTAPLAVSLVDRAGAAASGAMLLRCAGSGGLAKKHSTSSVKVKAGGATGTTRFLELTEGCLLDVAVTGGGARGKGPTLRLLAPDGSAADLGTKLRTNSRGATLNRFAIPSTGRWFVAVDAAPGFKGTMRVALTISPPKSWTATLAADAEAPSPAVLRFSAPPGAKLVVTLTPVSGGSARPVLADVLGPDEASLLATGTLGGTAPTVTFSTAAALVGGDHRVLVSAEPGFAGDVVCTVKLKLPRTYTFSLPDLPAGEDDEE